MASSNPATPRRTGRIKKPSLKALETLHISDEPYFNNLDEDDDMEKEAIVDTLLQNQAASVGKDIFSFQKKKKVSLMNPKSLDDELSEDDDDDEDKVVLAPKTPHKIRKKLKNRIAKTVMNDSSDDEPFGESDSEYSPSGSSEGEEENGSNPSQSDEEELSEESDASSTSSPQPIKRGKPKPPITPSKIKSTKSRKQQEYLIKTEEYFANNATKSVKTSNHTLDKLKTPRLSQDQLQKLLKKMTVSKQHETSLCNFANNNRANFHKWMYILHENFNVLLFGLGSKRAIMQDFQNEFLNDKLVIVVNGFFPSLTLKEILDAIIVDVLDLNENPANPYEACDLIAEEFDKRLETHLYLIVHNIEGDMLRNHKAQNILAKLSAINNIHLIASIDHINAPLIWNHSNLSKFNFTWWDVTSFLPYGDETSFESSMMVQRTGSLALSSLRNVFLSLTSNSKGIYLIIVKHQLENENNQYYQGLVFKDLYKICRESFLVSSDLALRAQLTEFVDHKMVKFKRSVDGSEYLIIPITNNLLRQFLTEHQK